MHGSILTSARVPFAMARQGLFFHQLGYVSPKTQSPIAAIIVQGVWASVLAASGKYDQLTDYVVFGAWIFYALCALAVILLRRSRPEAERGYRVPGYPFVPVVFIAVAVWLLINTIMTSPRESGIGLVILLLGVPVYWLFFRRPPFKASTDEVS